MYLRASDVVAIVPSADSGSSVILSSGVTWDVGEGPDGMAVMLKFVGPDDLAKPADAPAAA